ncbi:MAG TPA: tetratricopeptide repeat protein [Candidatus Polarisedimenticolaceae bacterium]|nr:tetratricopeptide repeat protein [Candidatus Polarisedimenticolaceae bacterium]
MLADAARAAILSLALLAVTQARADNAAADAAFDAGNNAKALSLYEEVLASTPNDVHALVRSGMLLSWDRRFDEALSRYDRALSIDPANPKAQLERAKVFLWSKRYAEARPAFEKILAENSDDREARLALARAYSWDGRQEEARSQYQRALDANPDDAEALLGIAQTWAWSGQGGTARPYYERALAASPGLKEAEMGLAYLDLDAGDTSAASQRAKKLATAHPDDAEIRELEKAVRKARAPWISLGYDHVGDTDDNRSDTLRLEGGFGLPARFDLRFGISASDLDGPGIAVLSGDGTASTFYGVLGWKPKPRHRAELRLGAARLTDSADRERTTGIGGLTYSFPLVASWTGRAAVTRDPFLYSPAIVDSEVDVTTASFGATGRDVPHVQVDTSAAYGDFSDGNERLFGEAGAWYVWKSAHATTLAGAVVRGMRYSADLDHGYFDPQRLIAPVGSLRSYGTIGASPWTYDATLEAGVQSYEVNGEDTSSQPLVNLYALFGRPLPHGIGLEIYGGWSTSSIAAGPDFRSLSCGARFRFTIGG